MYKAVCKEWQHFTLLLTVACFDVADKHFFLYLMYQYLLNVFFFILSWRFLYLIGPNLPF